MIALAARSATACTSRAGEGGGAVTTMGAPGDLDDLASARTYLPRLKPATGIGRCEVQREIFSTAISELSVPPLVFGRSFSSSLLSSAWPAIEVCVPVATSVHSGG